MLQCNNYANRKLKEMLKKLTSAGSHNVVFIPRNTFINCCETVTKLQCLPSWKQGTYLFPVCYGMHAVSAKHVYVPDRHFWLSCIINLRT